MTKEEFVEWRHAAVTEQVFEMLRSPERRMRRC